MLLFCAVQGTYSPRRTTLPEIDDSLLIRVGEDDRDAFEELYRKSGRAVYAFALSLLKNPDDTQDIVQETFLKIRGAAHLYRPMGKPMAWILTIARNLCNSRLRQSALSVEDCKMEDSLQFSYVTDPTDRLVLESALRILGEEERHILLLHCVAGMKHREIAQDLGMPLSTVLSRYNRSLKKLRTHLTAQGVLS